MLKLMWIWGGVDSIGIKISNVNWINKINASSKKKILILSMFHIVFSMFTLAQAFSSVTETPFEESMNLFQIFKVKSRTSVPKHICLIIL